MKEITIADIRTAANDITTLNFGYGMYQKKEYENYEYKLSKYQGLFLEGSCSFGDEKVTLVISKNLQSSCTCHQGFCKHKVTLFFLLKDTLSSLQKEYKDLELIAEYDIQGIMKSFVDEVSRTNQQFYLYPLIDINKNQIHLNLLLRVNGKEYQITDIDHFINTFDTQKKFSIGSFSFDNNKRNYKNNSLKLIELLKSFDHSTNLYSFNLLEGIYDIYKKHHIYLNGSRYYQVTFSESDFPIKLVYRNKQLLLSEKLTVYRSLTKSFIYHDKIFYVFDNIIHEKLLLLFSFEKTEDTIFTFDEKSEILFYTIIYDGLEEYFILNEEEVIRTSVDSYFDYKNQKLILRPQILLQNQLNELLPMKPIKQVHYENMLYQLGFIPDKDVFVLTEAEQIVDVICSQLSLFSNYGNVFLTDDCKKISRFKSSTFSYNNSLKEGFFDIIFKDFHYSKQELAKIFKGYSLKKKFVKINEDELVALDDEGYAIYKMFQDFNLTEVIDNKITLPLYQIYKLSAFDNLMEDKSLFQNFYDDLYNYSNEASLSKDLKEILRPYQIKAFNWLSALHRHSMGGILADDMGLGKTLEIIAMLTTIKIEKPVLIVSPTSLVFNWQAEFKKFASEIPLKIIYGNSEERKLQISNIQSNDIIICSYETVRINIELFEKIAYEMIIADEAQYLKNPNAYKTIAMKHLKAKTCFALTGTPIENSIIDLWSIFDFVLPGYLPNKKDYLAIYSQNSTDLENLSKQVQPFILRREKQNVLQLPPKIESDVYVTLEGEQLLAYEAYLNHVQEELRNSEYAIPLVLRTLIRLREFMCEPRLFMDNYTGENAKLTMLMEIFEESIQDEHRILLFSSFPSVFKYIIPELEKREITYDILDGKTPKEDRLQKVNAFNDSDQTKVFLISLKVGGSGLNLIGADMVIHYDPWWNIAATNQATDRAHRFGQDKEVRVIKMITKDTIEEKILSLQHKKAQLSDSIISESGFIKQLSKSELMDLFRR